MSTMEQLHEEAIHDGDVTALAFYHIKDSESSSSNSNSDKLLLVSGGRDRQIHVFSVGASGDLTRLTTIADHSAAISALSVVNPTKSDTTAKLISCGADKSVIFRDLTLSGNEV